MRWLVASPLLLAFFDEDRLSSDDLLGSAEIELAPFIHSLAQSKGLRREIIELDTQGTVTIELSASLQVPSWATVFLTRVGISALTGAIQALYHDNTDATMRVILRSGTDLKAADRSLSGTASSDPYVKIQLGTPGRNVTWLQRSSTVPKTLEPVWNEAFTFTGRLSEMRAEPLILHVYDEDKGSLNRDDSLGFAMVEEMELEEALDLAAWELSRRSREGGAAAAVDSTSVSVDGADEEGGGSGKDAYALPEYSRDFDLELSTRGKLQLTLEVDLPNHSVATSIWHAVYNALHLHALKGVTLKTVFAFIRHKQKLATTLHVTFEVRAGTQLKAADTGGTSDPYACVTMGGSVQKTKPIQKTLEPRWDATFEFTGLRSELEHEGVYVQVFDEDILRDDSLGDLSISAEELRVDTLATSAGIHEEWRPLLNGKGSILVAWRVALYAPSLYQVVIEIVRPHVMWLRAFVLYRRQPFDRTTWVKLRDPATIFLMLIAASTDVRVRGTFFTLFLLGLLRDKEEFQMMQFILSLKGTQFLSGCIKLATFCLGLWSCTVQQTCATAAPGVSSHGTILPVVTIYVWLQMLTWYAFLTLPYTTKYEPKTGTLSRDRADKLWKQNEAKARKKLFGPSGDSSSSSGDQGDEQCGDGGKKKPGRSNLSRFRVPPIGYRKVADGDAAGGTDDLPKDTLTVTLERGAGLLACDSNGKSDPFAVLTLPSCPGSGKKRSKYVPKTLDPVWAQSFEWRGDRVLMCTEQLHIQLYDRDVLSANDPMGSVDVDLAGLYEDDGVTASDCVYSVTPPKGSESKSCGTITLSFKWDLTPRSSEKAEEAEAKADKDEANADKDVVEEDLEAGGGGWQDKSISGPPATGPWSLLPLSLHEAWSSSPLVREARGHINEAHVYILTLASPLTDSEGGSGNRMFVLLKWDTYASAICLSMLLIMLVIPVYSDRITEAQMAGHDPTLIESLFHMLFACASLLDLELYGTWRSKVTLQVVKLSFALSAAPFFLFIMGGLAVLFTHTDPTSYNREGRVVQKQTTGLSAYLNFLKSAVLGAPSLKQELQQKLTENEWRRLKAAIKEGERTLSEAWQRPNTVVKVTNKKRDEIDALLSSLVTRPRFSEELFTTCFPDKVIVEKFIKQQA